MKHLTAISLHLRCAITLKNVLNRNVSSCAQILPRILAFSRYHLSSIEIEEVQKEKAQELHESTSSIHTVIQCQHF